jgi:hypothetical protein
LTHELIKTAVLDNVKNFYLEGFDETGMLYDEVAYKADVEQCLRPVDDRGGVVPSRFS